MSNTDGKVGIARGLLLVIVPVLVGAVVSNLHGLGYGVLGLAAAFLAVLALTTVLASVAGRIRG